MSKLELVNRILFQWLFIRLYKSVEKGRVKGWGFLYWVVPLSGWGSGYRWVSGKDKRAKLEDRKVRRWLLLYPLGATGPLLVLAAVIEDFEVLPQLEGFVSALLYLFCAFLFAALVLYSVTDRQIGAIVGLPRRLKWRTDGTKPSDIAQYIVSKNGVFGRGHYDFRDKVWDCSMSHADGDKRGVYAEVDAWTDFYE